MARILGVRLAYRVFNRAALCRSTYSYIEMFNNIIYNYGLHGSVGYCSHSWQPLFCHLHLTARTNFGSLSWPRTICGCYPWSRTSYGNPGWSGTNHGCHKWSPGPVMATMVGPTAMGPTTAGADQLWQP